MTEGRVQTGKSKKKSGREQMPAPALCVRETAIRTCQCVTRMSYYLEESRAVAEGPPTGAASWDAFSRAEEGTPACS